jgi:hypothetical protein
MKLYRDFPGGSMSMADDPKLRGVLRQVLTEERIDHVLETGTYQGLGSTTMVSECFPPNAAPRKFITVEANWNSWRQARANLRRFSFVTCLWGLTVELANAVRFVQEDDWIRNHRQRDEIFIDDVDDPIGFYTAELQGRLGEVKTTALRDTIQQGFDRIVHYRGQGLLRKWLREFVDHNPLVILDSAGGTGLLEFNILRETMHDRPYVLLLDDTHHVKHYRSLRHIQSDGSFRVVGHNDYHGWVLAKHTPPRRAA